LQSLRHDFANAAIAASRLGMAVRRRAILVLAEGYSFRLYDQSVMGVTDFSPVCLYWLTLESGPQEGNMAPKHKLGFIFAAVLVMAVFVAITTWAAVPKSHSVSATPTKGTIYRPDLWKVY